MECIIDINMGYGSPSDWVPCYYVPLFNCDSSSKQNIEFAQRVIPFEFAKCDHSAPLRSDYLLYFPGIEGFETQMYYKSKKIKM